MGVGSLISNTSLDLRHDPNDPSPWQALYLDQSIPLEDDMKIMWLKNSSSWSRQYFLPVARTIGRLLILVIQIFKMIFPFNWNAPYFLHRCLVFGLKSFVTPEANVLILRHFHLGSEVLAFIAANVKGVDVQTSPLRPMQVGDLKDNLFVKHDINLYNFIINLSKELREKNLTFEAKDKLDYQMLGSPLPQLSEMPRGFLNFVDLESALELFTPLYQLFLTDSEFWRATHSLQFDETIGVYAAKILKKSEWLFLVSNRHPLVPVSTHQAAHRLVLHGMGTEVLHCILKRSAQGAAL